MTNSPAEITAAAALANMSSNQSPTPSEQSKATCLTEPSESSVEDLALPPIAELRPSPYLQSNMGVLLGLGSPGADETLGFVPLFNAAPLTPTSLERDEDSIASTENAHSAEEFEDEETPREVADPGPPEPDQLSFAEVVPASHGYRSPSAVSFSDLPGSGSADSPYYVNTPPPGPELRVRVTRDSPGPG
ncbi:hypothetical protein PGT21_022722 [Puccinia graminis f. sp. tritici]|uniref:Uncharacterized protein n=1 Tax=Puccinia graminis f. sp. tritici TaxID=56615 RepID=A0A5B0RFM7_PUCGR|nr:hypothetical protein PGTUg99_000355 [Puccinia graminis f. sp. tritici]KAA1107698.1 hypothetical protein PGT21_022722 [Puccinia graminis f. sp. tritici]KAA1124507.1 hypothetical protein PGTUg99_000465 [Puccinia graminis f. sp. tritici]